MSSLRVRGGRGLGDAIYVRPIADALVRAGNRVTVLTDYPHVYLGSDVAVLPFQRVRVDVVAHYVGGKRNPTTTQWQDVCSTANIFTPLSISWSVRNHTLLRGLRAQAGSRPLVLVHGGRRPMARTDGFGMELMPKAEAFEAVLSALRETCFLVQIGKAEQLYPVRSHVNLNGSTSISDIMDLGRGCDAVVAQCSFAVPLAEAFGKPLLAVWGAGVYNSREPFVRSTTPHKVLSCPTDSFVLDDMELLSLRAASAAWLAGLLNSKELSPA